MFNSHNYNADLNKGLSLTGENAHYFADRRVAYSKACVVRSEINPKSIIDFGCGIGNNIPSLFKYFPGCEIVGLDVNSDMLRIAAEKYTESSISFGLPGDFHNLQSDLIYVNGVFHHIPPKDHADTIGRLFGYLSDKGILILFDNNPFNPGTRMVMKRIPFDRDARTINPFKLKQLLKDCGFSNIQCRFHFIFPSLLKSFRFLESWLDTLPIGGQYSLLAQK